MQMKLLLLAVEVRAYRRDGLNKKTRFQVR